MNFDKSKLWNVQFHDNYVAFLLKSDLEDMIEESAKLVYGDCKAIVSQIRLLSHLWIMVRIA